MKSFIWLGLVTALAASSAAWAATQGTLGATSTGTLTVSKTIGAGPPAPTVQVLNLSDFNFGSGTSGSSATAPCFVVKGAATFSLTVQTVVSSGSAPPDPSILFLNGQNGYRLAYSIQLFSPDNVRSPTLANGRVVTGLHGVDDASLCDLVGSWRLNYSIFPGQTVPADTYTNTVTFIVAPE